ncbi:MAG: adenylate kinase [Clostridia bacterium]|nr:adenylate kinase [Clostridia bacterium]
MNRIILLGAPGAGKGAQAALIEEKYNLPHISTGDALRQNIKDETELGKFAKSFIDKGELVPDDVVISIVEDRLKKDDCKKGFILDGFPRTIYQAEALAKFSDIDYVIDVEVPDEIVVDRISGRRMCSCGKTYHISTYKSDTCEKCGQKLYQRKDDNQETVMDRLKVYHKQTEPLIDYYTDKDKLVTIDGTKSIDEVFKSIMNILK